MLIGREVPTAFGGRIDILAIDADGNLTVIELKRNQTPREVVAQLLDYPSWVRHLSSEAIAEIFIDYQQHFLDTKTPVGIDVALQRQFNSVPDELNVSHRLLIVAGELDTSTERIVAYLQEQYAVDSNVAFFRTFEDEGRLYLTRTWLVEPESLAAEASTSAAMREWNGEFYVTFREDESRRWNGRKQARVHQRRRRGDLRKAAQKSSAWRSRLGTRIRKGVSRRRRGHGTRRAPRQVHGRH